MIWPWLVLGVVVLLLGVAATWYFWRVGDAEREARTLFDAQRPQLEQLHFEAAAASGKPRGLRWKACEWSGKPEFARERSTGRLAALVSVTIQFEAVPGSDMEGLPAVGNLRNASAVFFYHGGQWHTTGKTVFNLNPDEALGHFKNQYERLAAPPS
jgi:hypothetical protein